MARRFVVAFAVLLLGAVITTLFVLIATNGYGTAGVDVESASIGYLLVALFVILVLAGISTASSTWLSRRLRWRGCLALLVFLAPALLLELFLLLFVGVGAAMVATR